ncbi:MAG: hypothetical protein H6577_19030 [Lewinellaceae bacterium]|nr:hypothetical protein [Saprospiraceae bacterium]MCB9340219.1 hypothetical protein [Lewinellaceae bacterium]
MKKAIKDFYATPAILLNKTRMGHLKTAVANRNADHISSDHYGPASVRNLLEDIYHEKCSYCESTVKQVATLQVEHYRPKNAVSEDASHPGYYWLVLEWSNLLLGCPSCNGQGAKGNKFPIYGSRVMSLNPFDTADNFILQSLRADQSPHFDEQAILLHPEIDDPDDHLKFTKMGEIEGVTERGRGTIEICNLNRDTLFKSRQAIINNFLKQCEIISEGKDKGFLDDAGVEFFLNHQLNLLLQHRDDPKAPYTSFVNYILNHPETCILPRIEPLFQPDFQRAFAKFKQEALN